MSADGEQGGVLLPCPFCGVSGIVFDDDKHLGWMAMCGKDCEMLPQTAWKTTKREAVDLWNTRAAPATDTPEVDRYSEGREAGIRETLRAVADMMKVSGHLVHPIFIPAVEGLVPTLAKHPTSPEDAA